MSIFGGVAVAGTVNTSGGGGGGGWISGISAGQAGGSGVVIIAQAQALTLLTSNPD